MSKLHVDGRAWDAFDGYLFDIDGTLLQCTDAVHYFAFCKVLSEVAGRELTLEGVNAHGNVDTGILRDAMARAEIAGSVWRPRLPEMHAGMVKHVEEHRQEICANVLPGVLAVLDHLRGRKAALGVATGNLEEIGRTKLERAGLMNYFSVGGWSDAFEDRSEVFRNAVKLMREFTHADASICVVGDTPNDVSAARANGLPVIAVATGIYSREQLGILQPELCLASLGELMQGVQEGLR